MGFFPLSLSRVDLRKTRRFAIRCPASIKADAQSQAQVCIIHDISDGGAKLTFGLRNDVPNNFTLTFSRDCRVVWRADGQVGVEFLPT